MTLNFEIKGCCLYIASGSPIIPVVGDNADYIAHFDRGDNERTALFAVFRRDGKASSFLIDQDGNVTIPLWVLKKGKFEVGVIADGYATTAIEVHVLRSIVNETAVPAEDPEPSVFQQLLQKIEAIRYVKGFGIADDEFVFKMNDGTLIKTGYDLKAVFSEMLEKVAPDLIADNVVFFERSDGISFFGSALRIHDAENITQSGSSLRIGG